MAEGDQQQAQEDPTQALGQAVDRIGRVQSAMELSAPTEDEVIDMLQQAGDAIWAEVERRQQQQNSQKAARYRPRYR